MSKVTLTFAEISQRLKRLALPDVDWVIGIATGGIVPASLVAHQLSKPLLLLSINFRDQDNVPRHENPQLLVPIPDLGEHQHILLVDDVSVTGQTLTLAQKQLASHHITTLVLKGQGDFVLFPEVAACVNWPWHVALPIRG